MKRFLKNLAVFLLPLVLAFIAGLLLPATPRARGSLLSATLDKDALLRNAKPPRMIFVGGSNLSFGLNSKLIEEQLNVHPINTGLQANLGLRFMLGNTVQCLQQGDVVVVAMEYVHFTGDPHRCTEELLRTVLDVDRSKIRLLSHKQLREAILLTPKYAFSKFKPTEYLPIIKSEFYGRDSFNEYGDASAHWGLTKRKFAPDKKRSSRINYEAMDLLYRFREDAERKGATVLVTFPGLQDASFDKNKKRSDKIMEALRIQGYTILGTPERYRIPDRLTFNTPYHLNKEGVDYRTRLFIEDYANYAENKRSN